MLEYKTDKPSLTEAQLLNIILNYLKVMSREEVYKILDGERAYQEARWGDSGRNKPTECYLTYMKSYLDEAFYEISHKARDQEALDKLRKVVALGIACFEFNGVPPRA